MRRGPISRVVAGVLMLALAGAPLARARAAACAACPSGCPMHASQQNRLGCHERGSHGEHHCAPGPGLAPPGCGHARELPGVALPPAVLPARVAWWPAPAAAAHRPHVSTMPLGSTDPPETPPPIAA